VAAFVLETVVEGLAHRVMIERPEMITTSQLETEATDLVMGYRCASGAERTE
jgi:hypothetical protein